MWRMVEDNIDMKKLYKSGAVSLFVVIFSALLITVVTVGFISMMVRDQRQSSDGDLSQSAYDSALAGVEDAKRAILRLETACNGASLQEKADCSVYKASFSADGCNSIVDGLSGVTVVDGEVKIKGDEIDKKLNQAYTCVKATTDNPDYLGFLNKDSSNLIPLVGENDFSKIIINWYMPKDLDSGDVAEIPLLNPGNKPLLKVDNWKNKPSIMRAQLIQYGKDGFKQTDFDDNVNIGGSINSNTNTLFLYPMAYTTPLPALDFAKDSRRESPHDILKTVECSAGFDKEGYACTATINLPDPINSGARVAYLNLTSLYGKSNYRITLADSTGAVNFNGVQTEIDSTGRANDVFRRVKSRVEMSDTSNIIPTAAVSTEEQFCKAYKFYAGDTAVDSCGLESP